MYGTQYGKHYIKHLRSRIPAIAGKGKHSGSGKFSFAVTDKVKQNKLEQFEVKYGMNAITDKQRTKAVFAKKENPQNRISMRFLGHHIGGEGGI